MKKLHITKKNSIIIGIIVFISIIVLLFAFLLKKNKNINQLSLEKELTKIGANYYEKQFYPGLPEEDKTKLEFYEEDGISIHITALDNTIRLPEKIEKSLQLKNCDKTKTKIIIYPKAPYGIKDYEIKTKLSCKK